MIKFKVNFQNSIQLGDNIYIDPYQLKEEGKANYIFDLTQYAFVDICVRKDNEALKDCP